MYVRMYMYVYVYVYMYVYMYVYLYMCIYSYTYVNICKYTHIHIHPPKMREIALWSSTNGAIVHFLVLPASLLSITEITEYNYFSPISLSVN